MCVVLFFFFFKQKTAYEVRISDWRSGVCSSDLHGVGLAAGDHAGGEDVAVLVHHALAVALQRALPAEALVEVVHVARIDRKSVVEGKSVSVRVDLGGRCIIKKKMKHTSSQHN